MLTLTSPIETPFHRLPAGAKLAMLSVLTISLFLLERPLWPALMLGMVMGLYLLGGLRFLGHGIRMLLPLWPFVAALAVWHIWTGEFRSGELIILRLVTAVAAANLVTMTTRLSDMLDVIETVCRPLAPLIPPRRLALAFALVIRFIPVMGDNIALIRQAWRARSPRKPRWRILVPGVLAALDEADRAAEALRARGGTD